MTSLLFVNVLLKKKNRITVYSLFLKIYLSIYFWLCCVLIAVPGLSLVVVSRGYSPVALYRLLMAATSLVVDRGL